MIVVTGGAGFIGSCFVGYLNKNGRDDIVVVDDLGNDDKWRNLVGKSVRRIYGIREFRTMIAENRLPFTADAIVHMGACSATTESNVDYLLNNNTRYSIDVADYALQRDIRLIYASSAATYGDGSGGYSDSRILGLRPLNPYGYSKQLFDEWVVTNGTDSAIAGIKFFNVFGPNEYHKGDMASMVYKSWKQISANSRVQLFKSNDPAYADGGQMRDFVYVMDCCRVMYSFLSNKSICGIFNLGSGTARTWNDMIRAVFASMDTPVAVDYIETPERLVDQYQNFTQADLQKLKSVVDHNFLSLEESVADYVGNYLRGVQRYY